MKHWQRAIIIIVLNVWFSHAQALKSSSSDILQKKNHSSENRY